MGSKVLEFWKNETLDPIGAPSLRECDVYEALEKLALHMREHGCAGCANSVEFLIVKLAAKRKNPQLGASATTSQPDASATTSQPGASVTTSQPGASATTCGVMLGATATDLRKCRLKEIRAKEPKFEENTDLEAFVNRRGDYCFRDSPQVSPRL